MDEVFDSALRETAERILPLAVTDIVGREDQGVTQRLAPIREHDEFFHLSRPRCRRARILLQSHAADPAVFPPYDGPGFRQTATHRLYGDAALQGNDPHHRGRTARPSRGEPPGKSSWASACRCSSSCRSPWRRSSWPSVSASTRCAGSARGSSRAAIARPFRGSRGRLCQAEIGPLADTLNSLLGKVARSVRGRAQLCCECRARASNAARGCHCAGAAAPLGDARPGH